MGKNLTKTSLIITTLGFMVFVVGYLFPQAANNDLQFEILLCLVWGMAILLLSWHYLREALVDKLGPSQPAPKTPEDRLKDFFVIASHELRAPLSIIRGDMAMIRDYYFKEIKNPDIMRIVKQSHASSVRLIKIVNDFLDASRLEQGKAIFSMSQVDTNDIINQLTDELNYFAKANKNALHFFPDTSLPLVYADPNRLKQVIYNLLANAINYTKEGTIAISAVKSGKGVKITVEDTGIGLPP
jgi:signal transduction histidine kinase